MTEHNPNTFYEMGFRHSLSKSLIPIREDTPETTQTNPRKNTTEGFACVA
ncbi:hypothetical protein [Bacillus mycoides]|nr:hypothetical protein [Bacillus mycoides]SCM88438.1 Protein of unknown function [Bacillus mycoides]